RMKSIQAIHVGDSKSMIPKYGCQRKKPYGFGPEIIRSKIMDPGIDKKNMGSVEFHGIKNLGL
ncbi:MAG: hypothetical protein ACWGNI_09080, partial [Desulfobacterales bacterium]